MLKELKAISTIIWLLLILCSTIIGGLLSYFWVMSSYYNMPQETTLLVVEDVVFPTNNFTYFNVSVLNPSYSTSDVNITAFNLNVASMNQTVTIGTADPALPFTLGRGTRQAFQCLEDWSPFTGQNVTIEPVAENVSTRSLQYTTPDAKLELTSSFDATDSVEYFNLTATNAATYDVNLTISEISVFGLVVNNTNPALPQVLQPNQTALINCTLNWANVPFNITITVKTLEGYETSITTNKLDNAVLEISDVTFDYTDSTFFNMTITSLNESTVEPWISQIKLTLQNGTTFPVTCRSTMLGKIFAVVPKNESRVFICDWDWTQNRDENVTVNAYTTQGFLIANKTVQTPPAIVWNVTDIKFDLDNPTHFTLNVTNMPTSLDNINITKVLINTNETTVYPQYAVLISGSHVVLDCTFNWTSLRGTSANVTVLTAAGTNITRLVDIPSVSLKLLDEKLADGDLRDLYNVTLPTPPLPYFNVTVSNSNNSLENVTITRITLDVGNVTYEIAGNLTFPKLGNGYILPKGETVTIICPWDHYTYLTSDVTQVKITIYTAEGFQQSKILPRN